MTDFEAKVLADLGVLKSQMDQLMGIGQPGTLLGLEARVAASERSVQRSKGAVGAFGLLLTVLHVAISYFGGRR
ncbi:hypothetical protein SAMN05421770_101544 [Granulicella rosea]|uniref:Uncharacterized protein n=1 Tax=Granulicella rosea TaxID=474952 RepID=A0A239DNT5_9BACT|nr:hypothetical protein [Granulicella rosea]SNS33403.1 hypothetical protein SAMN05421770_101544 [Granulicella rosea]